MQEGWGSGGDEVNLSTSQWEDEEGDMWNNTASQESNSSCSSWGNAPKKGLQKVGLGCKLGCKNILERQSKDICIYLCAALSNYSKKKI